MVVYQPMKDYYNVTNKQKKQTENFGKGARWTLMYSINIEDFTQINCEAANKTQCIYKKLQEH